MAPVISAALVSSSLMRPIAHAAQSKLRIVGKSSLERVGLDDHARRLLIARTARGRRGLRTTASSSFSSPRPCSRCQLHRRGGAQGRHPRRILRAAPNGRHIAFEPIPALAEQLRSCLPRGPTHALALADEEGRRASTSPTCRNGAGCVSASGSAPSTRQSKSPCDA